MENRQNVASWAGRAVGRRLLGFLSAFIRSVPSRLRRGTGSGGYNKLSYVTPQDIPVHGIRLTLVSLSEVLLMRLALFSLSLGDA